MEKQGLIYVSGHLGLLGSSILRMLTVAGYKNLIVRKREELDLSDKRATFDFFNDYRPKYVFHCAAKVGGILANISEPADFLSENISIQSNVLEAARLTGVKKLIFAGSSCIYPKECRQPMNEELLLSGPLEPTNEGYALAKLVGVKQCKYYRKQYNCDFISCLPSNLYGPNDKYDLQKSHLVPSLILKVHQAKLAGKKQIELWGTGTPRREFMYSDDCARAMLFLMENYSLEDPINIGTGRDHTVLEIAQTVSKALNHDVQFVLNKSKPDGMMKKLLDIKKIEMMGWRSQVELLDGIRMAYNDFLSKLNENENSTGHIDLKRN